MRMRSLHHREEKILSFSRSWNTPEERDLREFESKKMMESHELMDGKEKRDLRLVREEK